MVTNQKSDFHMKLREVIMSSGIPFSFPEEAIKETADIESEFKWPFIGRRLDLRGKTTFTIGSTEVAFSVEEENGDFILGIHSADVAHLFPLDSYIDESAYLKSRSIVFPEKKHFMIPESIATSFCALREGEESFTVSVFLRATSAGKIKSVSFAESVIKVTANCESEEVEALLFDIDVSSVGFLRYKYYPVLKQLEQMFVAGATLKMARQNRGADDVDTAVRTFSRKGIRGSISNVGFKKLSDPDRLVREIISAAGIEIAKYFNKHDIPCPYRQREHMSKKGIKELRAFLNSICIDSSKASDKELVLFAIDAAHGDKNEELILAKVKELLPTSVCSLESGYHGGIGAKYYVRFAYPVSRYSDLSVQRVIKEIIACGGDFESADKEYMLRCATRAVLSVMKYESIAKATEKRVSDLYALEFLAGNKNKTYEGTVWNISDEGVEVCLDNSCKGLLKGEGEYALGQRLVVKISETNLDGETVIFEKA